MGQWAGVHSGYESISPVQAVDDPTFHSQVDLLGSDVDQGAPHGQIRKVWQLLYLVTWVNRFQAIHIVNRVGDDHSR